jgi:hypothetical protein
VIDRRTPEEVSAPTAEAAPPASQP